MQNVPSKCKLELVLPALRYVSIHYWSGEDSVINRMLAHAEKLEHFDSYKLYVQSLTFASNHLEIIDLHRSDTLSQLRIYAPNLSHLGLQACYNLEQLVFTENRRLTAQLPKGHQPPPLDVNTLNAVLGPAATHALQSHPRANIVNAGYALNPMEAMFASMR